jgi:hypothetical protein
VTPQIVQSLPVREQIAYWLLQAAEARSLAADFKSDEARRTMLGVAGAYERMARHSQERLAA